MVRSLQTNVRSSSEEPDHVHSSGVCESCDLLIVVADRAVAQNVPISTRRKVDRMLGQMNDYSGNCPIKFESLALILGCCLLLSSLSYPHTDSHNSCVFATVPLILDHETSSSSLHNLILVSS